MYIYRNNFFIMSKFSGKCDFYDAIGFRGEDYMINKSEIYVDNIGPLKFKDKNDLIPYYPYIIAVGAFNDEGAYITLSRNSYVIERNNEKVDYVVNSVKKYIKKCKRNKKEISVDDYINNVYRPFDKNDNEVITNIFNKVVNDDNDFTHCIFNISKYYIDDLINHAKENGVDNHPIIRDLKYRLYNELF